MYEQFEQSPLTCLGSQAMNIHLRKLQPANILGMPQQDGSTESYCTELHHVAKNASLSTADLPFKLILRRL